ncbi:MAG: 30S ribosomal protein S4e [Candidatus Hodarchaeales archaeon]|jgi:small subunit ribosomal protein S4e
MGKKGQSKHLKRLNAPKTFRIARKHKKFTLRPRSQSSKLIECIPLAIIVREMLGFARNMKEAKHIIRKGEILTDNVPRRDIKHSVGPMDTLSIPKVGKYYRILPWEGRRQLKLAEIDSEDKASWKLCKITGKRTLKKGNVQINLHDGRNILIKEGEQGYNEYKTGGTLKIEVPNQKILDYYPFNEDVPVLVMRGTHSRGVSGILSSFEKRIGKNKSIAMVSSGDKSIITALDNIFVLGRDKAEIEV